VQAEVKAEAEAEASRKENLIKWATPLTPESFAPRIASTTKSSSTTI